MTSKSYSIKSPAKINIGLHVKNRREDGFHNIETIFYPIPLNDELKIKIKRIKDGGNKITVRTNPEAGIDDKNNICSKAAQMFLDEFKIPGKYRIDIKIKKKIPIGAGLGGGSSNAAAVLKILSKHFKVKPGRLPDIALKLGSDVPFFLLGKAAFASLRGERLTLLPKFKINYDILIVNPNIHVSTKWAYEALNVKKLSSKRNIDHGKKLSRVQTFIQENTDVFTNDFEKAVFKKYPSIRKIKDDMYNTGAVFSSMSGSGSTVYGFYEKGINSAAKYFKGKKYKVFKL